MNLSGLTNALNFIYSYRFVADTAGTQFYPGHLSTEFGEGIMGGFLVKKTVEKTYDAQNKLMTMGREYYTLLQVFI